MKIAFATMMIFLSGFILGQEVQTPRYEPTREVNELQVFDMVDSKLDSMFAKIDIQLKSKNGECVLVPILDFKER